MSGNDVNSRCTTREGDDAADDGEMDSADEALCAMLGLPSIDINGGGIREEAEQEQARTTNASADDSSSKACINGFASRDYYYSETTRPTLEHLLALSDAALQELITNHSDVDMSADLRYVYRRDRVVCFPHALCVQAAFMRRITEEVVWRSSSSAGSSSGGGGGGADKTYETIRVVQKKKRITSLVEQNEKKQLLHLAAQKQRYDEEQQHAENCCNNHDTADDSNMEDDDIVDYVYQERKCLTRLENFCRHHAEWNQLCTYIGRVLSIICDGTEMVLYKEKLNLKPPGGSGFAPHLDTPSLLVAATCGGAAGAGAGAGPTSFVTVMVAIDDMTDQNGCLRVVKGPWTAENAVETIAPDPSGNPDANGRAGAIPQHVAESLVFESLPCKGGTIVVFDGHVPHRSSSNTSAFARRAVFLTYNPRAQGDFHDLYYQRMHNLRNDWRRNVGLPTEDEQWEMQALSTIPKN
jgi:ectoine hydroxylase-related dioxygenase (phytanoyl-CoA dioxygenase family)